MVRFGKTIAICDDMQAVADEIEQIIKGLEKSIGARYSIAKYTSGSKLIADIDNNILYDMYFLDIRLGGVNGIEIGKKIRGNPLGKDALLFYVSSYPQEYFQQLFDLHIYNIINKPLDIEEFERKFMEAVEYMKGDESLFVIMQNRRKVPVKRKNIVYIESNNKLLTMYVLEEDKLSDMTFRMAINDAFMELRSVNFVRPHASYIVNLEYVTEFGENHLVLCGDPKLRINVTLGKAAEMKAAVHKFMLQRGSRV